MVVNVTAQTFPFPEVLRPFAGLGSRVQVYWSAMEDKNHVDLVGPIHGRPEPQFKRMRCQVSMLTLRNPTNKLPILVARHEGRVFMPASRSGTGLLIVFPDDVCVDPKSDR
jgi:hypothetical protein